MERTAGVRNRAMEAVAVWTLLVLVGSAVAFGEDVIRGQVLGGGAPIASSTVTLWEASAGTPKQLAQTKTNEGGRFEVRRKEAANDRILYLIAAGGAAKSKQGSGDNAAIVADISKSPKA